MRPTSRTLWLCLALLLASGTARAEMPASLAEPSFCNPDVFLKLEVPEADAGGIRRLHVFRLGTVFLAGLAIGESDAAAVARLAAGHGAAADVHSCTWYVNKGNAAAEQHFRQIYLPNPTDLSPEEAAGQFGDLLQPAFAEGSDSVWWCLEEKGYLAVGCNGQMHRGPTAFGMVLAALGCSAENAAEIVNRIWGLNGVPPDSRLAAIRRGGEFGASRAQVRSRLQRLLSGAPPGEQRQAPTVVAP